MQFLALKQILTHCTSALPISITSNYIISFDANFTKVYESSSFDSVIPTTFAFDAITISLSSSIFDSILFIFKCIKCRPLFLKTFKFSVNW